MLCSLPACMCADMHCPCCACARCITKTARCTKSCWSWTGCKSWAQPGLHPALSSCCSWGGCCLTGQSRRLPRCRHHPKVVQDQAGSVTPGRPPQVRMGGEMQLAWFSLQVQGVCRLYAMCMCSIETSICVAAVLLCS